MINPNEFEISRTVIQRVIDSGDPVLTTNAQEDPRFGGQESIVAYNLRSILCVPLKARSELLGVIYADNRIRSGIFSEAERELLTVFANQAAIAIENARLFASVRRTLNEVSDLKSLMDNVFASIANGVITANIEEQITLCNRRRRSSLACEMRIFLDADWRRCCPVGQGISGRTWRRCVSRTSPSWDWRLLTPFQIVGLWTGA